jgi:hypothetical protein
MSGEQNTGQNCNIKTGNKYLKNLAKFKYLRMKTGNQNFKHGKTKNRLN